MCHQVEDELLCKTLFENLEKNQDISKEICIPLWHGWWYRNAENGAHNIHDKPKYVWRSWSTEPAGYITPLAPVSFIIYIVFVLRLAMLYAAVHSELCCLRYDRAEHRLKHQQTERAVAE